MLELLKLLLDWVKLLEKTLKICNEIIEKEDSKYLKDEIGFILSIHEALKNIKKD